MAYTKTTWVNGSAPAINASNLQNIEDAVDNLDDILSGSASLMGSLSFAGAYKLVGLAEGSASGESVRYEQVLLKNTAFDSDINLGGNDLVNIGILSMAGSGTIKGGLSTNSDINLGGNDLVNIGTLSMAGSGIALGNISMSGKLTSLSAGSANGDSVRYEQLIQQIAGGAHGDLYFRGSSTDERLAIGGSSGMVLTSHGASKDPIWQTVTAGGGGHSFTATNSTEVLNDNTPPTSFTDLDLTSATSADAVAVSLHTAYTDSGVGNNQSVRKNGASGSGIRTFIQVSNVRNDGAGVIGCDAGQIVEYNGADVSCTTFIIYLEGYWD